jgi:hypothetical protein
VNAKDVGNFQAPAVPTEPGELFGGTTYSAGHLNTLAAVPCIIICTSAAGR